MEKYDEISIAKGIGISLMVIGHSGAPQFIHDFIYLFHMPLFFIISGYLIKDKYLNDFNGIILIIKRRFKSIIIPFVKWSILFILAHNILQYINIYNINFGYKGVGTNYYSINETLECIYKALQLKETEPLLGGYWFLPQLFLGITIIIPILWVRNRIINFNKIFKDIIILSILFVITFIFYKFGIHTQIFPISWLTFYSSIFIYTGKLIHENLRLAVLFRYNILAFLSIILIISIAPFYIRCNMCSVNIYQIPIYYIIAILASILVLNISKTISLIPIYTSIVLKHLGNNTIHILTWHFLYFKIVSLIIIAFEGRSLEELAQFPILENTNHWESILYSVIGLGTFFILKKISHQVKGVFKGILIQNG